MITLKKLDMNTIKHKHLRGSGGFDYSKFLFVGSNNKPCIRNIMCHLKDKFPAGRVFTDDKDYYKKFIPEIVISKWNEEGVDKFIKRQEIMKNKQICNPKYKNIDPTSFLLCDLDEIDSIRYSSIKKIIAQGRHLKITSFFSVSNECWIKPSIRTNFDYIFIFKEIDLQKRRKLHKQYAPRFPSFQEFCKTLDNYTEDGGCLVICNCVQSSKFQDCVFWFKPEYPGKFQVCDCVVWDMIIYKKWDMVRKWIPVCNDVKDNCIKPYII